MTAPVPADQPIGKSHAQVLMFVFVISILTSPKKQLGRVPPLDLCMILNVYSHFNSLCVCPFITERLLMGRKEFKSKNNYVLDNFAFCFACSLKIIPKINIFEKFLSEIPPISECQKFGTRSGQKY